MNDKSKYDDLEVSSATCANCGGSLVTYGKFEPHTTQQCLRQLKKDIAHLEFSKRDNKKKYYGY